MQNAGEASRLFDLFIKRTSRLEDIQKSSSKLLSGYHQELEKFRRPPLHESSSVIARILEDHPSPRVTKYIESGCHHVHLDQQIAARLDMFARSLQDHIQQGQDYIKEIQELVENVTCLMDQDLKLMLETTGHEPSAVNQKDCILAQDLNAKEFSSGPHLTSDYAMMMSAILGMLEKDLQMQEIIVSDLRLDTDFERLQTYCQMWDLRPFIDDQLIQEASNWAHN